MAGRIQRTDLAHELHPDALVFQLLALQIDVHFSRDALTVEEQRQFLFLAFFILDVDLFPSFRITELDS